MGIDWEESFVADDKRPLIPEGKYKAQCIKHEPGRSHHNSIKMFLRFKIIEGPCMETELFMAMNLMDSKTGKRFKKVPLGSKYYKSWVIANYGKLPAKGERMSPRIFKSGIFEVQVRTTKPRFPDGTAKPRCFHYSVVDYLFRREI